MHVTVEVVGEETHDLEVEDATYADLLREVDLSPHEVSVMVDGRPVPEDRPVEHDHVKVLRLIKGGSGADDGSSSLAATGGWELGVTEVDFELPNAGTGPDPFVLSAFAAGHDAVVVFFQRDYRCDTSKEQVQALADRYGEFRDRDAVVVSVLPESAKRANKWQQEFHLPFPLVADEDKSVAEQYGQPTRWGKLGGLHDLLGRLPEVAILDARDGLRLWSVHRGEKPDDRPSVDEVLRRLDALLGDSERRF